MHDHGIHLAKCHSVGRASWRKKRDKFCSVLRQCNQFETLAFLSSHSPLYTTLSMELSKHIHTMLRLTPPSLLTAIFLMAARACPLQRESPAQCRNQGAPH